MGNAICAQEQLRPRRNAVGGLACDEARELVAKGGGAAPRAVLQEMSMRRGSSVLLLLLLLTGWHISCAVCVCEQSIRYLYKALCDESVRKKLVRRVSFREVNDRACRHGDD